MSLLLRHPLPAAICGFAVAVTAGVFVFARPQYRPAHQGTTIRIPDKRPAADAAGKAGWVWPDGVPGWEPGQAIKGFPVSQLQPIEAQSAELSAAYSELDAGQVHVIEAMHTWPGEAPLAIFAAPMIDTTPKTVCLAAALPRGPVQWRCPGASRPAPDVANSRVLVAAVSHTWPHTDVTAPSAGFDLVGVARGDVKRIVLRIPGEPQFGDAELYDRGTTWGQFSAALALHSATTRPQLRIYGDHGLVQVLTLALRPGQQRTFG